MGTVLCVPVHSALNSTRQLLTQLQEFNPDVPLVIVDDASNDETAEFLISYRWQRRNLGQTCILLHNTRQQLFTRTVNRAWREAVNYHQAELVVTINTDCTLEPDWLVYLEKAFQDPKVGMAGYWDNDYPDVDWLKELSTPVKIPAYVTGHCFGMRVAALQEVGVLCETDTDGRADPSLAPYLGQAHIGSERLLGYAANIAGWKSVYINAPMVFHGQGESWKRDLSWLGSFKLQPLWAPLDSLSEPVWYDG